MRNIWNLLVAAGILTADRMTKSLALHAWCGQDHLITSYLNISFVWNRGVSWGVFSGASPAGFYLLTFLIAMIIAIFACYTVLQWKRGDSVFFETLVLSGAASNFFDRLYYGAVIDFIDLHLWGAHWPTFNVADACIVIGIGGIVLKGFIWTRSTK